MAREQGAATAQQSRTDGAFSLKLYVQVEQCREFLPVSKPDANAQCSFCVCICGKNMDRQIRYYVNTTEMSIQNSKWNIGSGPQTVFLRR